MAALRPFFFIALALAFLTAGPAAAGEWQRYTAQALEQAQAEGKIVYVAVHASWCSVCKRQIPILAELIDEDKFADAVAFNVDWDTDRRFVRRYNVRTQATVIAFQGHEEVGRLVYNARADALRAVLESAL